MKPRPVLVVVAALLVVVVSGPCVAQVDVSENTIEASVAQSSLIVRATILDEKFEHVNDRPAKKGWIRTIVTLKVNETLKGKPVETVTFGEGMYEPGRHYEAWKAAKTECLWFFGPNTLYGKPANSVPDEIHVRFPLQQQFCVRLGPGTPIDKDYTLSIKPMFIMDLTVVKGPDAVLKAVRAAVPYPSDRERAKALLPPADFPIVGHSISVPRDIMARSGPSGDANSIGTPIDRRLETLARRLIKSPGDFLPKETDADRARNPRGRRYEEDQLRAEGAKALRYFKSDENAALLKPLLADPASTHVSPAVRKKPDDEYREYFVRKQAYETLKAWGVAVGSPVIREPWPRDDKK